MNLAIRLCQKHIMHICEMRTEAQSEHRSCRPPGLPCLPNWGLLRRPNNWGSITREEKIVLGMKETAEVWRVRHVWNPPFRISARGCPDAEVIPGFAFLTFRQLFLTQLFCWDCLAEPGAGGGTPSTPRVLPVITLLLGGFAAATFETGPPHPKISSGSSSGGKGDA